MRHPENEFGDQRICPETKKQFRECWTNNLKKPWSFFNECDQCNKGHKSIAEMLYDLNNERKSSR